MYPSGCFPIWFKWPGHLWPKWDPRQSSYPGWYGICERSLEGSLYGPEGFVSWEWSQRALEKKISKTKSWQILTLSWWKAAGITSIKQRKQQSEFLTNAQKNPPKKPPREKSRLDQTTWGLIIHDFSPLLGVQKNLLSSNSWTVKEMRSPTCRVEGTFREAEHLLPTEFNGCPHNKRLVQRGVYSGGRKFEGVEVTGRKATFLPNFMLKLGSCSHAHLSTGSPHVFRRNFCISTINVWNILVVGVVSPSHVHLLPGMWNCWSFQNFSCQNRLQ